MIGKLKKQWHVFQEGKPGRRFQERYERNREARSERSWFARFLEPFIGMAVFLAGVVLCFIPGPGLPLVLIGAGLLADVSRPAARAMDWAEVRIRKLAASGHRWWKRAPTPAKSIVVVLAVLVAGGAALGGFWFLRKR
jgi:hypothetical protein